MKLGCLFFVGSVLVNAHFPSMSKTFTLTKIKHGCRADKGCTNLSKQQCEGSSPDNEYDEDGKCKNIEIESALCLCDVQFLQPTSPFKRKEDSYRDAEEGGYYGVGYGGYYYDENAPDGTDEKTDENAPDTPCGQYKMLIWNDDWNVEGQQGSIDMAEKTFQNADYFDCTENGGEWREVDGASEWTENSGAKYCRTKFDFFGDEGPKRASVDTFLCKTQCKEGTDCPSMEPWPKCSCDQGTAPGKDNWKECLYDGNHQCSSCSDPTMTPVADRYNSEIRCQKFDPYHLVDCGRDPTIGMRVVPKAMFAPYSNEMCAYWVKQDKHCQGDYFYTINDLSTTDFSEQGWQDFYNKRSQVETKTAAEWEEEKKTFLRAELKDISSLTHRVKSHLSIHKQKQYGCWCRVKENDPDMEYIWKSHPTYEQQNETWVGYSGNTYKFNVDGESNEDVGGPLLLTDAAKGCPNFNYKIEGLTSDWGCPKKEPKPIFGWILADTAPGQGCLASPFYNDIHTIVGGVVNVPNGKYSFMCYASNLGIYKMQKERMRSWLPGPLSIGSKFKHNMVSDAPSNEEPLCGRNSLFPAHENNFKRTFVIDDEDRPIWFVIRNWEFIDGRMYFLGEEKVEKDYDVTADPRWADCKKKFTTRAPYNQFDLEAADYIVKQTIQAVIPWLNGAMTNPENHYSCSKDKKRLADFMTEQAKKESIRGLVYNGEQLWNWYTEGLGEDERAICGSWEAATTIQVRA